MTLRIQYQLINILLRLATFCLSLLLVRWLMDLSTPEKDWLTIERTTIRIQKHIQTGLSRMRAVLWSLTGATLFMWYVLRKKLEQGGYQQDGT